MKPIERGGYRLRNGRKAIVRIIDSAIDVKIARGGICDAGVEHPAQWTADDGLRGLQPGPWDIVERLPDDGSAIQMKLGYWEDAQGAEWRVCNHHPATPFPWQTQGGTRGWDNDGKPSWKHGCSLVTFLHPLEDLPPALNSAVKAAEDRVRELNDMVAQTAAAWATARRLREAAQRELERLEKECEVKP